MFVSVADADLCGIAVARDSCGFGLCAGGDMVGAVWVGEGGYSFCTEAFSVEGVILWR